MDAIQKRVLIERFSQHIENAFDVLSILDNEGDDYALVLDDWTDIALSHLFIRSKIVQMISMHGKLDIPEDLQIERAKVFQNKLGKLVTEFTGIDPRDQARNINEKKINP